VLALAVVVDPEPHLERLVLAPEGQEPLVLALAVDIDPEPHLERLVLAPER